MGDLLGDYQFLQDVLEEHYKEALKDYIEKWELGNGFSLDIKYDNELYLFNITLRS